MEIIKVQKDKVEDKPKSNPMEQSEYCYYQSMGKALIGLERALELRGGRIDRVRVEDILDNSDIGQEEFENVFKNAKGLLNDVHEEIHKLFSDIESNLSEMDASTLLTDIFMRLKQNCPMLRVLRLVKDHTVWRNNLRQLVVGIAKGWPLVGSPAWEYLYANFCCQFALMLEIWEASDFADERLADCIRLLNLWLTVDGVLGRKVESLLNNWSTISDS